MECQVWLVLMGVPCTQQTGHLHHVQLWLERARRSLGRAAAGGMLGLAITMGISITSRAIDAARLRCRQTRRSLLMKRPEQRRKGIIGYSLHNRRHCHRYTRDPARHIPHGTSQYARPRGWEHSGSCPTKRAFQDQADKERHH